MTEVATMIAMSHLSTPWMMSTHYTFEQMTKDLDMAITTFGKTKMNDKREF